MKCLSLSLGYFLKPATFSTIKRTVTLELCCQGIVSYSPAQTMRKEPSPRMIALTYVFRYSSLTPLSFSRRSVLMTLIGDFSVNCTPSVANKTSPRHIRRCLHRHMVAVYSRLRAETVHCDWLRTLYDASYENKRKL